MRLVAFICVLVLASAAHAETPHDAAGAEPQGMAVALLPLDADQALELYGHPIATEIAKVLEAGGIDVVVVGRKMAVPARARLVLDGTIKSGKGTIVYLTVRVRDAKEGTLVATIPETAASLEGIEHAAEEVAGKALPAIKKEMAEIIAREQQKTPPIDHPKSVTPVGTLTPMLAVVTAKSGNPKMELLRGALATAMSPWARRRHHELKAIDLAALGGKAAPKVIVAANADVAVWFEVQGFTFEDGLVPMGRARVRLQIINRSRIVFDRIIVTDTVIGARASAVEQLSPIVARAVVDIAEPHVHRAIPGWQ